MQSDVRQSLANNPFAGLGEAMLSSVQLSWGWAVLVVGSVCLIAAALLKNSEIDFADNGSAVGGLARISDRAVYVALGVIFAGWLAFIAYNFFMSMPSSSSSQRSSSSATSTPTYSSNSISDDLRNAQYRADEAMKVAANAMASSANTAPLSRTLPSFTPVPSSKSRKAMIISENANFRSTSDSYGDIIDVIPYGEEVEIRKQQGPWFQVKYAGITGWVHGNTIQLQ